MVDGGFIRNHDLMFMYDVYKAYKLKGIMFWPGDTDTVASQKWMLKTEFLKCQDNLPGAIQGVSGGICEEWVKCVNANPNTPLFDLLDVCAHAHTYPPMGGGGGGSSCSVKCLAGTDPKKAECQPGDGAGGGSFYVKQPGLFKPKDVGVVHALCIASKIPTRGTECCTGKPQDS